VRENREGDRGVLTSCKDEQRRVLFGPATKNGGGSVSSSVTRCFGIRRSGDERKTELHGQNARVEAPFYRVGWREVASRREGGGQRE
jgi:hypothetical protein